MINRLDHLGRLYGLLDILDSKLGGKRRLSDCDGRMKWPVRGVYFFFERGELRSDSGTGLRVVRVGTHGVSAGSRSSLWRRLAQHRGNRDGLAGNHRGSVFRVLIGAALSARDRELETPTWGHGQSAPRAVRDAEEKLERAVSAYIGVMPFLWLKIDDDPSPTSLRAYVERNSIALLSNASCSSAPLDSASEQWLGRDCPNVKVVESGLWNQRNVGDRYDSEFLQVFGAKIASI